MTADEIFKENIERAIIAKRSQYSQTRRAEV
jgi:hypothetical protein